MYLFAQIVVLEISIPWSYCEFGFLGNHLLYTLCKLLGWLMLKLCLGLQEIHITDNSPACHECHLQIQSKFIGLWATNNHSNLLLQRPEVGNKVQVGAA